MPLSQFNTLLTDCGYDPVTLENQHLMITPVQEICDTDLSNKALMLNGKTCFWAGSRTFYPDFAQRAWMYYVVPDEAVTDMPVSDICAAYTPKTGIPTLRQC